MGDSFLCMLSHINSRRVLCPEEMKALELSVILGIFSTFLLNLQLVLKVRMAFCGNFPLTWQLDPNSLKLACEALSRLGGLAECAFRPCSLANLRQAVPKEIL